MCSRIAISAVVILFVTFTSLSGVYAASDEAGEEEQTYAEMLGVADGESATSSGSVTRYQILAGLGAGTVTWWGGIIAMGDRNNDVLFFTGLGLALSIPIAVPMAVSGVGYSKRGFRHFRSTLVGGLIGAGAPLIAGVTLGPVVMVFTTMLGMPISATIGSVLGYRWATNRPERRGSLRIQEAGTVQRAPTVSAPAVMPIGGPADGEWGMGVGWSGSF